MVFGKELQARGFSPYEINAIEWVLIRMGMIQPCEHLRPHFAECYRPDPAHTELDEVRWQKFMREMGFGPDAITLAESAIFDNSEPGTA
jgi:hypothetical protein